MRPRNRAWIWGNMYLQPEGGHDLLLAVDDLLARGIAECADFLVGRRDTLLQASQKYNTVMTTDRNGLAYLRGRGSPKSRLAAHLPSLPDKETVSM
jgi:hypothetical protein